MASIINHCVRRFFQTSARRFAKTAKGEDHEASMNLWRRLTFFVGFPAIGLGMLNAYLGHMEHAKEPRPEFVPYEHLRIRKRPFPWGDGNHSLFHNPVKNALPEGYEVPDPNAGNPRHH